MSSVSRRESEPSTTAALPESPDDAKASSNVKGSGAAAPGSSTAKAAGSGMQGNQVEAYSGPPRPPTPSPSNRPPPSSEGGLTAAQLAFTGSARRGDAAKADAVYSDIRAQLTRSLSNWVLNGDDVRRVHERLETLPPADYRKMMERMERDGLLEKYVDTANPEASRAFLSQAERKGYVSSTPGEKASFAIIQPPEGPKLYRNDAGLPSCIRDTIHETNMRAAREYYGAHQAYVKQYAERVGEAKNPLDIRRLGEPRAPFSLSEPGMDASHPDYKECRQSWTRNVKQTDSRNGAYVAVSNRMADLSGIQRPGTFWFKAEAELKAELGPLAFKVGGEVEATQYGKVDAKGTGGAELELKLKEGKESGSGFLGKVADKTAKVGAEFDTSGERKVYVGEPREKGTTELEMSAMGPVGAYAVVNLKEGKYGGGVRAEVSLLDDKLKAQVGLGAGMQGARLERAKDVASREEGTLFGSLPELEQQIPWGRISPERRERMVRDGWTAESWAEALKRPAPQRR